MYLESCCILEYRAINFLDTFGKKNTETQTTKIECIFKDDFWYLYYAYKK